ncbi:MAG: hydroxymethylglutaryl-CoA synthase [Pseudomonadota bacterium]
MTTVGIDKIGFYTPHYVLSLSMLAAHRGVNPDKFLIGLGQHRMSVPAPDEDVVTMAANAAERLLRDVDCDSIDTLLFATESGIDQSKSAGIYVHGLLNLPQRCRVVELKQACYSATQALQMACAMVQRRPDKNVLIIAADIARYGLCSSGEPSQGGGAVAMLISAQPRLLAIEPHYGLYTNDIMDFWRPNYRREALVEGKYSAKMYLQALKQSWQHYKENSGHGFNDFSGFLYHAPVPRLVEKAHKELARYESLPLDDQQVAAQTADGLRYGREIGNTYTASLYIGLISLLENSADDLSHQRIGLYSYGSGCVAEYFSGVIQAGYQQYLDKSYHQQLIEQRQALSIEDYEKFFTSQLPRDGSAFQLPQYNTGNYRLAGIENHKRLYERNDSSAADASRPVPITTPALSRAISPGKIILSGEHAVVYGKPAIALAVNRYAETTVVADSENDKVDFDLLDLHYHKSLTKQALKDLKSSIKRKYHKFLNQECTIQDVIKQPVQLVQFATAHLMAHLQQPPQGIKVSTQSNIPVGCGMGSSAAVSLSVLKAINEYYGHHVDSDMYLKMSHEIENLQHGNSSGIDLNVSLYGGCVYVNGGDIEQRPIPRVPMFLVNTGKPRSSTGESVSHVRQYFAEDAIWNEFAATTNALDQLLASDDVDKIQSIIRHNHRLLCRIEVVPQKVQQFIQDLEQHGAAAKICGAGSVVGDNAGMVLVITDQLDHIKPVCRHYHYTVEPVIAEHQGLRVA